MAVEKDIVQFRSGNPGEVVERMADIVARNTGKEWLNLQPWVDVEQQPKVSLLRHIFSSRGQPVPTGTWVPGHTAGKEPTHSEVGLQHGSGVGAIARLNEAGVHAPEGWVLLQENTRRGLVWAVERGFDLEATLVFMLRAAAELSGVPTDDRWLAGFVQPSS